MLFIDRRCAEPYGELVPERFAPPVGTASKT